MANEINAVAGQLWGIPMGQVYTAGPGIKIDNVHKIVSVDETVLSDTATLASVGAEISLSEAYTNFERIRIECIRNHQLGNASYCNEFAVDSTHNAFRCVSYLPLGSSVTSIYIAVTECSLSGTKLTVIQSFRYLLPGVSVNTNAPDTITKIVGINRISA